jgi:alkylated DNA repair protein (DNA oxidative demethylase)
MNDLFDKTLPKREQFAPGAMLLRGFASRFDSAYLTTLNEVIAAAPLRHMTTPGGFRMSVAMTNCGTLGWVTDRSGYRYTTTDPESGLPWPPMPDGFKDLAVSASEEAGFSHFMPDACLINRYPPGAKMALHQDKDELTLEQPVVSLSLGIPAIFLFGGLERKDKPIRMPLTHGDVVVWGGPARLRYHGILPIKANEHPLIGPYRINITFRKAGKS